MAGFNGTNIVTNNLILYYDFFNEKSYIFNSGNLIVNDLISNLSDNDAKMNVGVNKINGIIDYNSTHNFNIPHQIIDNLESFTIDIWFVKGDVTLDTYSDGIYYSTKETILTVLNDNYDFEINLYFDSSTLEELYNYGNTIYNIIVTCDNGDITYIINKDIDTNLNQYQSIISNSNITKNDFIGKILSLKIYDSVIVYDNIKCNFKNLKNRKWV